MIKYILSVIIGILCLPCIDAGNQSKDVALIKQFYARYIFGQDDFVPYGKSFCSTEMLDYLSSKYDYDCPDGDCYAIWLFRSGHQDGPSDVSRVTRVTSLKNNTYQVDYVDMGIVGTITIELSTVDKHRVINKIVNNEAE